MVLPLQEPPSELRILFWFPNSVVHSTCVAFSRMISPLCAIPIGTLLVREFFSHWRQPQTPRWIWFCERRPVSAVSVSLSIDTYIPQSMSTVHLHASYTGNLYGDYWGAFWYSTCIVVRLASVRSWLLIWLARTVQCTTMFPMSEMNHWLPFNTLYAAMRH
jgi:hypothetical protein